MPKKSPPQPSLFDAYGWKSVGEVQKQDVLVVEGDQEAVVTGIRQEGDMVVLTYTVRGEKAEQLYMPTDSVYAKKRP